MRTPPHSLEAEKGLIGSLLQGKEVLSEAITLGITDQSFWDQRCRELWGHCRILVDSNKPCDWTSLVIFLTGQSRLEAVGGLSFIGECNDSTPSAANLSYFASILKEKEQLRALIQVSGEIIEQAYATPGSPSGLLDASETRLLAIRERDTTDRVTGAKILSERVLEAMEARIGGPSGLPTGYPDLDKALMGGLQSSDMIVLAGRPSAGKTALAVNIAENVMLKWLEKWEIEHPEEPYMGQSVGIFSLEMTAESIAERMLASLSNLNTRLVHDYCEADYLRLTHAIGRLAKMPLLVDDSPTLTVGQIRAKARRFKARHRCGLVLVDYLQLIQGEGKAERRVDVDGISRGLKALSKELAVPIIVLAQLNRETERDRNRKPRLADLRESGQIEQDADVILFLYPRDPEAADAAGPHQPREILCRIGKQRNGPRDVDIPLVFRPDVTRFESVAKIDQADVPRC